MQWALGLSMLLCCLVGRAVAAPAEDGTAAARQALVEAIERDVAKSGPITAQGRLDPRVMEVLGRIPRHLFVPADQRPYAYENRPLPIGYGQTISQPYIVALMTDLLRPDPGDVVLEVGTGSGYQAAVLSALVAHVYSLEIIEPLGEQAAERLKAQGYANVTTRIGDGYYGWEEHAPYDGIVVTAAASGIPPPLVRQLKPGGRMVIPVGGVFATQQLMLVEKDAEGQVRSRQILPVRFVPLTGAH